MGVVRGRHWAGALLGGLAAWLVILVLASLYSVVNGYGPLGPYQGTGDVLGFGSTAGLVVGFLVDLVIPLIVALLFVVALSVLSRRPLPLLAFVTKGRATLDGALTGLVVWAVFYTPVTYSLSHSGLTAFVRSLLFGLLDHLAFGAVIGLVVFVVGGPVPFGVRPASE